MDPTNDTANPESGPQGGPATPPAPAPASGDDYRSKYSGLVSKFDTLKAQKGYEKWEDVPALSQVQAWQQSHSQLADVQNKVTSLSGELEVTRGESNTLKTWQAKVKAILEIDPSLIEFVDDIATLADGEAQKTAITSFSAKLAKRAGPGPTGNGRPPVPTLPPSSPPIQAGDATDSVALYSRMSQLLQASHSDPSKRAEYEKAREQWYAQQ